MTGSHGTRGHGARAGGHGLSTESHYASTESHYARGKGAGFVGHHVESSQGLTKVESYEILSGCVNDSAH